MPSGIERAVSRMQPRGDRYPREPLAPQMRSSGLFPGVARAYHGHDGYVRFWNDFRAPWRLLHKPSARTWAALAATAAEGAVSPEVEQSAPGPSDDFRIFRPHP